MGGEEPTSAPALRSPAQKTQQQLLLLREPFLRKHYSSHEALVKRLPAFSCVSSRIVFPFIFLTAQLGSLLSWRHCITAFCLSLQGPHLPSISLWTFRELLDFLYDKL